MRHSPLLSWAWLGCALRRVSAYVQACESRDTPLQCDEAVGNRLHTPRHGAACPACSLAHSLAALHDETSHECGVSRAALDTTARRAHTARPCAAPAWSGPARRVNPSAGKRDPHGIWTQHRPRAQFQSWPLLLPRDSPAATLGSARMSRRAWVEGFEPRPRPCTQQTTPIVRARADIHRGCRCAAELTDEAVVSCQVCPFLCRINLVVECCDWVRLDSSPLGRECDDFPAHERVPKTDIARVRLKTPPLSAGKLNSRASHPEVKVLLHKLTHGQSATRQLRGRRRPTPPSWQIPRLLRWKRLFV
jgi:hypothetical protein